MGPARERTDIIATLQAALVPLEQSMSSRLIPPEGASFGFALRGARDNNGVAAVRIGMHSGGEVPGAAGPCTFGTDEPAVRAILTALKFDPVIRSAAVLRFSDRALAVLEDDLFLDCASYAPGAQGISTMDWGIASCCKEGIPDVIYEKSSDKTRARLMVFGEDPADVANNIIICSGRI
jgi:hydroxymethylpyrimidine/phosphomethylpyrimidine kinase